LIAYFYGNISAENYQNRLMFVEVIAWIETVANEIFGTWTRSKIQK